MIQFPNFVKKNNLQRTEFLFFFVCLFFALFFCLFFMCFCFVFNQGVVDTSGTFSLTKSELGHFITSWYKSSIFNFLRFLVNYFASSKLEKKIQLVGEKMVRKWNAMLVKESKVVLNICWLEITLIKYWCNVNIYKKIHKSVKHSLYLK